ncbi:hypothetical protein Dcar01_03713 [Deinococcus carri]|uniref:DUF3108 domain-containing protein n=1 Tax=Deinococcus carri TaxID=1211323 RepID=A0ABP9WC89_9DEIO
MKRLFLPFLLVTSTAHAAEVDCSTIQLFDLHILFYKEKAVFPEPAKKVALDLTTLKSPFTGCGATFTTKNKGEVITIQAEKRPYLGILTNHFRQPSSINLSLDLLDSRGNTSEGLEIDLTLMDIYTTYDASISVKPVMYKNTAVGVKVDGGKIQPLFWSGESFKVPISKKAKVVDFYVKTDLRTSWQRVSVNLAVPKITVYRKAAFPAK